MGGGGGQRILKSFRYKYMPRKRNKTHNKNKTYKWFANLVIDKPRFTRVIHILIIAAVGLVIGLVIATAIYVFATLVNGILWIYLFGIGMAFLFRIVGQYVWIEQLRPLVPKYARPMIEKRGLKYSNKEVPVDLSDQLPLLVAVAVTTAIATILATEDIAPEGILGAACSILVPAAAGFLATALESIASPSTLYTLLHNRSAPLR